MKQARSAAALAVTALALVLAGCGGGSSGAPGLRISGAGLRTGQPPWAPEYAHLPERLAELKLPPVGSETFHIHAALHIYKDGLLMAVPAEVGLLPAKHIEASLHTHDGTGIIHMEAAHRFNFTLGDFFKVWGVELGPEQVGGLKGLGGDKLHFFVNGRPLKDPAAFVMRNGDNFSIGYGPEGSFPRIPGARLLREVEEGRAGLNCSASTKSKAKKSCLAAPAKAAAKH